MLRKANKISTRAFPKEERPFKSIASDSFSLSVFLQKESGVPRASVVVSKKIAKTAVERNKIRRRLYSIVRKTLASVRADALLIFYVKKSAFGKRFSILESEVINSLNKI